VSATSGAVRRPPRRRWLFALLLLPVAALPWLAKQPDGSREWADDQAIAAVTAFDGDRVHIANVRDFRYATDGTVTPGYYDADYDLGSVETVWFVLTAFSKRWRSPAHTFVSFGFGDGRYLAISVEARREKGEIYNVFAGLFPRYELLYVIGDERDLVGRRAAVDRDATYLYPVRTTPERARELLVAMLRRANALLERPEFYNTLFNSCTSNLVDHVNEISPGRIPTGLKTLLPGYTDDVAASLGLIEPGVDAAARRARYRINERALAAIDSAGFSGLIRTASP
jgi:hypothetical protein